MATIEDEFKKTYEAYKYMAIGGADTDKILDWFKSYVLSLMAEVKLEIEPINEKDLSNHAFEMGRQQAISDQQSKIQKVLKEKGIL